MGSSFRENLRNELDYQGVTVKELCTRTGIPKATLECYLGTRANTPSVDAAVKIAGALGVSVEYLATGYDGRLERIRNPESHEFIRLVETLDKGSREVILTLGKSLKKMQEAKNRQG